MRLPRPALLLVLLATAFAGPLLAQDSSQKQDDPASVDSSAVGERLRRKGLTSDPFALRTPQAIAGQKPNAGGTSVSAASQVGVIQLDESAPPPVTTTRVSMYGSDRVAPPPWIADRVGHAYDSLVGNESGAIKKALAATRALARDLTPEEIARASSLDPVNPNSVQRFVDWLQTVSDDDLPPISYAVLGEGDFGEFQDGPGKGKVLINHSILHQPSDAQAAVFAHELFHYWDFKVSDNVHEERSNYGSYVDPQNKPELEFMPYSVAKIFATHAKAAESPLVKETLLIPDDPEALKTRVRSAVNARKK